MAKIGFEMTTIFSSITVDILYLISLIFNWYFEDPSYSRSIPASTVLMLNLISFELCISQRFALSNA